MLNYAKQHELQDQYPTSGSLVYTYPAQPDEQFVVATQLDVPDGNFPAKTCLRLSLFKTFRFFFIEIRFRAKYSFFVKKKK